MNKSGVFVGQRTPGGPVEIVGRGLPMMLNDAQAQDVVGGICVTKGWIVLPQTGKDGADEVRIFPRNDDVICALTAIRDVVDKYDRQLRDPASVRGAVEVRLTDLVRGLVDHALREAATR